jgi:hypothetical protein
VAKKDLPQMLRGSVWHKRGEEDLPVEGGTITECYVETGITIATFVTTRGTIKCITKDNIHYTTLDGKGVTLLPPPSV